MGMMEIVNWALFGAAILVFAYVLTRSISFAYFRTKLEYLRAAMKEMTKGD